MIAHVGTNITIIVRIQVKRMFNRYHWTNREMKKAPVNDAVAPCPYEHKQFNGSLWYQSPFKGPPTPEVEKAWYDVMNCMQGEYPNVVNLV